MDSRSVRIAIFVALLVVVYSDRTYCQWAAGALVATGALLNAIVILANGFRMPVAKKASDPRDHLDGSTTHCLLTPETRFPWLADIFRIEFNKEVRLFGRTVRANILAHPSIGDLLIFASVPLILYMAGMMLAAAFV